MMQLEDLVGFWFDADDIMPDEYPVTENCNLSPLVMVKYIGPVWNEAGHNTVNGYNTLYTYAGEWFNVPEDVKITHWRYIDHEHDNNNK